MTSAIRIGEVQPQYARVQGRIYELDLLRLLAARMVMGAHYFSSVTGANRMSLRFGNYFGYGEALERYATLGLLGVELFFILSGFVVALSAEGRNFREFLATRVARILPGFWLCCLMSFLLFRADPGFFPVSYGQLFANMFFLARPLGYDFIDGVYWSLVVEIRFYALVAVLILVGKFRGYHTFLALWLALSVLGEFLALPAAVRFLFLPEDAHLFVLGGAICMIRSRQQLTFVYVLLGIALMLAVKKSIAHQEVARLRFEYCATLVLCGFVLVLWAIASGHLSGLGRRWMIGAGASTYPLYLLHEGWGFMSMRHFPWHWPPVWVTALATLVVLAIASAGAKYAEAPLVRTFRLWILSAKPQFSSVKLA